MVTAGAARSRGDGVTYEECSHTAQWGAIETRSVGRAPHIAAWRGWRGGGRYVDGESAMVVARSKNSGSRVMESGVNVGFLCEEAPSSALLSRIFEGRIADAVCAMPPGTRPTFGRDEPRLQSGDGPPRFESATCLSDEKNNISPYRFGRFLFGCMSFLFCCSGTRVRSRSRGELRTACLSSCIDNCDLK